MLARRHSTGGKYSGEAAKQAGKLLERTLEPAAPREGEVPGATGWKAAQSLAFRIA